MEKTLEAQKGGNVDGAVPKAKDTSSEEECEVDMSLHGASPSCYSQDAKYSRAADISQAPQEQRSYLPTGVLDTTTTDQLDNIEQASIINPTDLENAQPAPETPPELYTAFSRRTKHFIIFLSAYGGFISPLSAGIYFPILTELSAHYHVSNSQINLTMTTYMIFQGLTPMFVDNFAQAAGFRPAFILCFFVYVVANVALATQDSYSALLVLRCLQSIGASGTIALRNGQIASVVTPAERGTIMGFVSASVLWGPAFSPSIGGALAQYLGWRSVFWFLAILSSTSLVAYALFMPETNRGLVGNGSVPPIHWWEKSFLDIRHEESEPSREALEAAEALPPRKKVGWPNPWSSLVMIGEKDTAIVLFYGALLYAALYDVMTSLPVLFSEIYGFDTVQVSLCYIPLGAGAALASILNGKLLNHNWRHKAHKHNLPYSRKHFHSLRHFPIEAARLRSIYPMLAISTVSITIYGWLLHIRCPLAGPLVFMFIGAMGTVSAFSSLGNLLIDMYHARPSTITATQNVTRCLMGAGATACVQPMLEALGPGWCFTLVAGMLVGFSPLVWVEKRMGPKWREERFLRIERLERDRVEKDKEREKGMGKENGLVRVSETPGKQGVSEEK